FSTPSVPESSDARQHAARVLRLHDKLMPLIETGEAALGAEIQPVLSDRVSAESCVVDSFRKGVARAGLEPVTLAATHFDRSGMAVAVAVGRKIDKSCRAVSACIRHAGGESVGNR